MTNLEVAENAAATFECEISKDNQTAMWFQAGEEIKPGVGKWKRYSVKCEGRVHRLVIDKVEAGDVQEYSCSFKDKKTSALLTIKGATLDSLLLKSSR